MGSPDPLLTRAGPEGVADAVARLLAHRHAQRGRPTPGDAADEAFARFLHQVPLAAGGVDEALRAAGEAVGRAVYAKTFVDEPLPRALAKLADDLRQAGLGRVEVESTFHRSGVVRHDAADAPPAALPFVEGAFRGYLSECYNCEARTSRRPDGRIEVALGAGRDVNGGRA